MKGATKIAEDSGKGEDKVQRQRDREIIFFCLMVFLTLGVMKVDSYSSIFS